MHAAGAGVIGEYDSCAFRSFANKVAEAVDYLGTSRPDIVEDSF